MALTKIYLNYYDNTLIIDSGTGGVEFNGIIPNTGFLEFSGYVRMYAPGNGQLVLTNGDGSAGAVLNIGGISSTGNILPGADDTYELGSTTKMWRRIYVSQLSGVEGATSAFISNLRVYDGANGNYGEIALNDGAYYLYDVNGNRIDLYAGAIFSSGHVAPYTSGIFDLGAFTSPWRTAYISNVTGINAHTYGNTWSGNYSVASKHDLYTKIETLTGGGSTPGAIVSGALSNSLQLANLLSDEIGTGRVVLNSSPTLSGTITLGGIVLPTGSGVVTLGSDSLPFDGSFHNLTGNRFVCPAGNTGYGFIAESGQSSAYWTNTNAMAWNISSTSRFQMDANYFATTARLAIGATVSAPDIVLQRIGSQSLLFRGPTTESGLPFSITLANLVNGGIGVDTTHGEWLRLGGAGNSGFIQMEASGTGIRRPLVLIAGSGTGTTILRLNTDSSVGLSGSIIPTSSGNSNLGTLALPFNSGAFNGLTVNGNIGTSGVSDVSALYVSGINVKDSGGNYCRIYHAPDALNASVRSLYIEPYANLTRLYLGTTAKNFYSLNLTGIDFIEGAPDFAVGNLTVSDEPYGIGWSGDLTVPTKKSTWEAIQARSNPSNITGLSITLSTINELTGVIDSPESISGRTLAINNYLSGLSSSGGGVLKLPNGFYPCGQIIQYSNTAIVGDSQQGTILFAKSGLNTDFIISDRYDFHSGVGNLFSQSGIPCNLGLYNLTIHGNNLQNSSGTAVKWFARGAKIDNCYIYRAAGHTVDMNKGSAPLSGQGHKLLDGVEANQISNCTFETCKNGIILRTSDVMLDNVNIGGDSNQVITGVGLTGIYLTNGAGNILMNNVHIYGQYIGLYTAGSLIATNLEIEFNASTGLVTEVGGGPTRINNFTCFQNNRRVGDTMILLGHNTKVQGGWIYSLSNNPLCAALIDASPGAQGSIFDGITYDGHVNTVIISALNGVTQSGVDLVKLNSTNRVWFLNSTCTSFNRMFLVPTGQSAPVGVRGVVSNLFGARYPITGAFGGHCFMDITANLNSITGAPYLGSTGVWTKASSDDFIVRPY